MRYRANGSISPSAGWHYYIELYRSGRWQHYYTRSSFAVLMRDVIGR